MIFAHGAKLKRRNLKRTKMTLSHSFDLNDTTLCLSRMVSIHLADEFMPHTATRTDLHKLLLHPAHDSPFFSRVFNFCPASTPAASRKILPLAASIVME